MWFYFWFKEQQLGNCMGYSWVSHISELFNDSYEFCDFLSPWASKSVKKWLSYAPNKLGTNIFKIDVIAHVNMTKNNQKFAAKLFLTGSVTSFLITDVTSSWFNQQQFMYIHLQSSNYPQKHVTSCKMWQCRKNQEQSSNYPQKHVTRCKMWPSK